MESSASAHNPYQGFSHYVDSGDWLVQTNVEEKAEYSVPHDAPPQDGVEEDMRWTFIPQGRVGDNIIIAVQQEICPDTPAANTSARHTAVIAVSRLANPSGTRCALNSAAVLVSAALGDSANTIVDDFLQMWVPRPASDLLQEPASFLGQLLAAQMSYSIVNTTAIPAEQPSLTGSVMLLTEYVDDRTQLIFCHCDRIVSIDGYEPVGMALWKGNITHVGHFATVVTANRTVPLNSPVRHIIVDDSSVSLYESMQAALGEATTRGFKIHGILFRSSDTDATPLPCLFKCTESQCKFWHIPNIPCLCKPLVRPNPSTAAKQPRNPPSKSTSTMWTVCTFCKTHPAQVKHMARHEALCSSAPLSKHSRDEHQKSERVGRVLRFATKEQALLYVSSGGKPASGEPQSVAQPSPHMAPLKDIDTPAYEASDFTKHNIPSNIFVPQSPTLEASTPGFPSDSQMLAESDFDEPPKPKLLPSKDNLVKIQVLGMDWKPQISTCRKGNDAVKRTGHSNGSALCEWVMGGSRECEVIGESPVSLQRYRCIRHGSRHTFFSANIVGELASVKNASMSRPLINFKTHRSHERAMTFSLDGMIRIAAEFIRCKDIRAVVAWLEVQQPSISISERTAKDVISAFFAAVEPVNILWEETYEHPLTRSPFEISWKTVVQQLSVDFTYAVARRLFVYGPRKDGKQRGERFPVRSTLGTLMSNEGYVVNARIVPIGEGAMQLGRIIDIENFKTQYHVVRTTEMLTNSKVWYVDHVQMMAGPIKQIMGDKGCDVIIRLDRFHAMRRLLSKLNNRHPHAADCRRQVKDLFIDMSRNMGAADLRNKLLKIMEQFSADCNVHEIRKNKVDLKALTMAFHVDRQVVKDNLADAVRESDTPMLSYGPLLRGDALGFWEKFTSSPQTLDYLVCHPDEFWHPGTNQNEAFHAQLRRALAHVPVATFDYLSMLIAIISCEFNLSTWLKHRSHAQREVIFGYRQVKLRLPRLPAVALVQLQTEKAKQEYQQRGVEFLIRLSAPPLQTTKFQLQEVHKFDFGSSGDAECAWDTEADNKLAEEVTRLLQAATQDYFTDSDSDNEEGVLMLTQRPRKNAVDDVVETLRTKVDQQYWGKWSRAFLADRVMYHFNIALNESLNNNITYDATSPSLSPNGSPPPDDNTDDVIQDNHDWLSDDEHVLLHRRAPPPMSKPLPMKRPRSEGSRPETPRTPRSIDSPSPGSDKNSVFSSASALILQEKRLTQRTSPEGNHTMGGSPLPSQRGSPPHLPEIPRPLSTTQIRNALRPAYSGTIIDILSTVQERHVWWRGRITRAGGTCSSISWYFAAFPGSSWSPIVCDGTGMSSDLPSDTQEVLLILFPFGLTTLEDHVPLSRSINS